MSYRNALSAALARIAVLEEEVAHLERELSAVRARKNPLKRRPSAPTANIDAAVRKATRALGAEARALDANGWCRRARERMAAGKLVEAVACYNLAREADASFEDPPQIAAEVEDAWRRARTEAGRRTKRSRGR